MRRTLISLLFAVALPLYAQLPLRIDKGGTNQTTFSNDTVVFFDGVRLLSLTGGTVGDCLIKTAAAPGGVWSPCAGRYELSTTAANGITSTFSFPVAVTSVTTVFVGGVAQTPSDISISGGNIVLGVNITPPPAGVEVSALYNGSIVGAGGTVTSVGASGPSGIFTWANSPITSSGTLTASLNSQSAHTFLGGLTSGSGTPAFRLLDPSDVLPSQGGTGANNTATSGRYLKGNGTEFVTSSGSASGVGNCPTGPQQFVTGTNSDAAPTCAAITGGMISGAIADVQDFTTAGTHTWTKPFTTGTVHIECIGAGGGATSGGISVFNGAAGSGAAAGGGAVYGEIWKLASELTSTVTVTVGTHGNGGAAASGTAATNGNNGSDGTNSSFGSYLIAYHGCGGTTQAGAGGGEAGACTTITGGAPRAVNAEAIAGQGADSTTSNAHNADRGGASGSSVAPNGGGSSIRGGSGGGAGGFATVVCGGQQPGPGGASGSYAAGAASNAGVTEGPGSGCVGSGGTPTAGSNGATGSITKLGDGGGGGGGFDTFGHAGYDGHLTMAGGNGGVGSGGGGGGGILWRSGAAVTSGKGGDGGDGACRVTAIP